MIEMKTGQCKGTTKNGTGCRFPAGESGYCHRHDPDPGIREHRSQAGRNGGTASGKARRKPAVRTEALPPIELKTLKDSLALREQTTNDLRAGRIDLELAKLQLRAARDHANYVLDEEAIVSLRELQDLRREMRFDEAETWKRTVEVYAAQGARIIGRVR